MNIPAEIHVSVPNDYGRLRHVVWGAITKSPATWKNLPEILDAGFIRQAWYNRIIPVQGDRAAEQHREFRRVLEDNGVIVYEAISLPETITQLGTLDIGFAIDDMFIPARPRRHFRQRGMLGLRDLLPRLSKVGWLDFGHIEGGDVALHDGEVLVGMSGETDANGIDALRHLLALHGSKRSVVPLGFAYSGVIHLDTALVVIAPHVAVAHPTTFDDASLRAVRDRFEIIELTDDEAYDVQVNVVPLGEGRVVVEADAQRLGDELAKRGFTPVPVAYDAVTTLPGSFHCTTLPLARDGQ